ncbi:hypothetical protein [Streptomyces edwardsiae]|uniref:Uncharacterized protein n=1 Tax=Streptomyces edwardsiae TaxID=3075527 RepID=A0ABU2PQY5_9ACTN|nr:hypothetical protein [Streptomyces sp. DSM 41636]MDT0393740.1 hypothetical protein [Streptomyces sp. DSM 41636]
MTTWWLEVYRQFFDSSAMLWSRAGIRGLMMPSGADFDDRLAELTRAQPAETPRPDGCDAVITPA